MSLPQTSVGTSFTAAFGGMVADCNWNEFRTAVNEETSAVPFGIAVKKGTNIDDFKLLAAVTDLDNIMGVTTHSHAYENQSESNSDGIPANDVGSIMKKGRIYVRVEEAVAHTDVPHVRFVVNAGTEEVGAFRKSLDSNTCAPLRNAKFVTETSAAGYAMLEFDFTIDQKNDVFSFPFSNASLTADTTSFCYEVPADKFAVLESASYYNETGLAEDATNFFNIKVQDATTPTVAANWSTETGEEGSIAADTPVTLTNAALANRVFTPGERINIMYDEDGTATLPAGSGNLNLRLIG